MAQDEASKKAHENTLWKIAGNFMSKYYDFLPQIIKLSWDELEKQFPKPGLESWDTWAQSLVNVRGVDQDTVDEMKKNFREPFPINIFYFMFSVIKVLTVELETTMNVYSLDKQYEIMGRTTPHPAPVDNLIRSMIIDPGRATENRAELKKHGFDETQIDNIVLSYYKTIDEGTLQMLYLRNHINESTLYERMRELGYTDQRTQEIVQTWELIPGPQDLFMMVAKEAFEPDIYRRLGLDQEFPSEQIEWLEKQGINRGWAEKYWIAHWDQPSIGQGFEMLHRGVITREELDLLFRAVEIPNFWRDKLTQIAYNPYTRVDVRRMHELNILDDSQLIQSYMDLGYDSEKALNMANFTIRFNAEKEVQLTRSAVLSSYNEGLISRTEASDLLQQQDYSADLAEYYLTLEDYNRDKALQKQRIDNTRDEFLLNIIPLATARTRLNQMGLRGETIDVYLETWELDRYKYQTLPSKTELDRFLQKEIIDEGQWRQGMERYGYSFQSIEWYLRDMQNKLEQSRIMPSRTDLGSWYKKNVLTQVEYFAEMKLLGYSDKYIQLYFNAL